MADELLSLRWNNHNAAFFQALSDLNGKDSYSDVTLACEGKFFSAHKFVLSTCSDYFKELLKNTSCRSPVIILIGISKRDIECLLSYMYVGEVEVKQAELFGLIQAAECLQVKGLAVAETDLPNMGSKRPISPQTIPQSKKRKTNETLQKVFEPLNDSHNIPLVPVDTVKLEENDLENADISLSNKECSQTKFENLDDSSDQVDYKEHTKNVGYSDHDTSDVDNTMCDDTLQKYDLKHNLKKGSASQQIQGVSAYTSLGRRTVYPCYMCNKTFKSRYHIDFHVLGHLGQSPFECSLCESKYRQQYDLEKHYYKHHKSHMIPCTVCQKLCSNTDVLEKHMASKHFIS